MKKKKKAFKNRVGGSMLLRVSEEMARSVVQGLFRRSPLYHDPPDDFPCFGVLEGMQCFIDPCPLVIIQGHLLILAPDVQWLGEYSL
jgi:hypothetical protein